MPTQSTSNARPIPLGFFVGISDTRREHVLQEEQKQPRVILSGSCSYLQQLTPKRFSILNIWLGPTRPKKLRIPRIPLVNYIADPDSHVFALRQAIGIVEKTGKGCFNDPRKVIQTRRDQIAQRLSGIQGLNTPATVRIKPKHPRDFQSAAEEHGLSFPLIVRLAGDHGGVSTIRVDSPNDWDEIYKLPWGGRAVYLTEFVDFKDADGLYRKCRIVFAGGEPMLHHIIIHREWLVHRDTRLKDKVDEEKYWLSSFENDHLPRYKHALTEIQRIIGLDFYGLDCHLGQDGVITLFECNAAMNVLSKKENETSHWDEPKEKIRNKLEAALESFAYSQKTQKTDSQKPASNSK